jgi:protein-L-isoaspartate(D-aspartate) O-methyltransferase
MTDYARSRKAMVDNQLRPSSITDRRLLGAMGELPRELFVPEPRRSLAYIDETHVLPGGSGRALPAPAPFARLVQLAQIGPVDTVLDVGCGSGYSAAVVAQLAARVVALESDAGLAAAARNNLKSLGIANVEIVEGPLDAGAPKLGPFDAIVVEGAVTAVSQKLFGQLKEGGRLVALIRKGSTAVANAYVRSGDEFASRAEFDANLPPLTRETTSDGFIF